MDTTLKTKEQILNESTTVAQKAANMIGKSFTQGVGVTNYNTTQPITSSALSNNIQPINIQTPSSLSTDNAGIIAKSMSKADQLKSEYENALATSKEQATANVSDTRKSLLDYIGMGTKVQEEKATAMQDPEFLARQQAKNAAYNTAQNLNVAQVAEIKGLDSTPMTLEQKSIKSAEINNRYALQHTLANVNYDIANRDYQSALDNINTAAQLKMEVYKPYIDFYTAQLQDDRGIYNESEKAILQKYKDDYTFQATTEADAIKSIGNFAIQVATNGADAGTIQRVSNAKTMAEAIQAAGRWINKPVSSAIPTIKSINGVDMQWNSSTGQWEKPSFAQPGAEQSNLQLDVSKANVDLINNLASSGGLNSAVGPSSNARVSVFEPFTNKRGDFIAGVEQMRSQLNLDKLIQAKAQGATFGALSNQELQVLASAATKLGTWAIAERNAQGEIVGPVTGYKATEAQFKAELEKINDFAKLDYLYRGGNPADVGATKMPNGKFVVPLPDGTFKELN